MSLVTETFKNQKRAYFSWLWRGLALLSIGIYAGIMIMKNGLGNAVNNEDGANALLRKLMAWLTEHGADAELLVTYGLVGVFCIIAVIGLFNVARGVWCMVPAHTMLGKSVLHQMKSHESFSDTIDAIAADLEQEPSLFGTVAIGRKWMLGVEVMRLDHIQGVFWFDQAMEDYVLCCVDEARNIWAASLRYKDDRDKAAAYLIRILPHVTSGDKDAYVAFLRDAPIAEV